MIEQTTLEQQIAALYATLAEATKECPCGLDHSIVRHNCCNGRGRVARFPGFRQVCRCTERGTPGYLWAGASIAWPNCPPGTESCSYCEGHVGWQVHAGGLEDGLSGLGRYAHSSVLHQLMLWRYGQDSQPSAAEILAEGLRLVIEVGLEVPDATT